MQAALKLTDRLMEATVALSYGTPGYRLRKRLWEDPDLDVDASGRVILITGANSGVGLACAKMVAERGATVLMGCRSRERGEAAVDEVRAAAGHDRVHLEQVDVSSLASLRSLVERVSARTDQLDALVNNAGVMLPTRQESVDGIEMTFATNVLGGFVLTRALLPLLEASGDGRVVNVTSGGMYTQRLEIDDLFWESKPYEGVVAYAQTKRAQVILNELWASRLPEGVTTHAMHPGWADTRGVQVSLPRFYKALRPLLRSPEQGADTAAWLAISPQIGEEDSGRLWLDRRARRTHVLPRTRSSQAERGRLWTICEALAG